MTMAMGTLGKAQARAFLGVHLQSSGAATGLSRRAPGTRCVALAIVELLCLHHFVVTETLIAVFNASDVVALASATNSTILSSLAGAPVVQCANRSVGNEVAVAALIDPCVSVDSDGGRVRLGRGLGGSLRSRRWSDIFEL